MEKSPSQARITPATTRWKSSRRRKHTNWSLDVSDVSFFFFYFQDFALCYQERNRYIYLYFSKSGVVPGVSFFLPHVSFTFNILHFAIKSATDTHIRLNSSTFFNNNTYLTDLHTLVSIHVSGWTLYSRRSAFVFDYILKD
jgi:hypothetical protein